MATATQIQGENGNRYFQKSTSVGSPTQLPPISKNPSRIDQKAPTKSDCCPYGYQLDLEFVQYAADAAKNGVLHQRQGSLRLPKKPKTNTPSVTRTPLLEQRNGEEKKSAGTIIGKPIYDNLATSPAEKRAGEIPDEMAKQNAVKTSLEKHLFSDSLENVMSDFEETVNRGNAGKGPSYNNDYGMSRSSENPTFNNKSGILVKNQGEKPLSISDHYQRSPALKASAGRTDGYASDYGYAVPVGVNNRSTAVRYDDENNYYATPNIPTRNKPPPIAEYASSDSATGHRQIPSDSDSLSTLSSPSSAQNSNSRNTSAIGASQPKSKQPDPVASEPWTTSTPLSPRQFPAPLPLKPALGLSGRVGMQIEQLASHLNSPVPSNEIRNSTNDAGNSMARNRLENSVIGGENRKLQDELNRLIKDSKRVGYQRSITPTILDVGGGGYTTALAKAMSSVGGNEHEYQRGTLASLPEPPPRRESVTRMKLNGISPSSTAYFTAPRIRTYSSNGPENVNGCLNLDAFHSYRRTNPLSTSSSASSNTNASILVQPYRSASVGDKDYVSDSEYALGERGYERFGALRRSRHLLSRQPTALPPTVLDDQQSKPENGHQNVQERFAYGNGNHTNGQHVINGLENTHNFNGHEKVQHKPLTRTIGTLTTLEKPVQKANVSTCTAPLPQPKPCMDCNDLRQRVLQLSIKPFTFTRGTEMDNCTCSVCYNKSSRTTSSIGCSTSLDDIREYRRDVALLADISKPCEDCERRNGITKIDFATNTSNNGVDLGVSTDYVEVRNRHTNTEQLPMESCATNTDHLMTKNAENMVDKNILLECGGYRTITSNTTPPAMLSFGVNTERTSDVGNSGTAQSAFKNLKTQDAETSTADYFSNDHGQDKGNHLERHVAPKLVRMVDKFVDSTVRTRDVGTRTPPPPPPPLQALYSSSTQTTEDVRVMVSIASGDCTLSLNECDACKGRKLTPQDQKSRAADIGSQTVESTNEIPPVLINNSTEQLGDSRSEPISQRGIQRVYSPKSDQSINIDPAMWTSQNSATSDISDRGAEIIEESVVVCPLDDDEDGKNDDQVNVDELSPMRKIDFTKPRQTRAFALSRAAAAKKLLTSDSSKTSVGGNANGTKRLSPSNFQRTSIQSKSVRLDSKKGDSLAYIADKKQFQRPQTAAASTSTKPAGGAQQVNSTGLKEKVLIKKTPAIRKTTPVAGGLRFNTGSTQSKTRALPYQSCVSSTFTTSAKDDDCAAEADDVVGPLPSEVMKAASHNFSTPPIACYTNLAAEHDDDVNDSSAKTNLGPKRLVGNVVENLPAMVERHNDNGSDASDSSERGDEDSDSLEEGSYDTNGNISSKCDVNNANKTTAEDNSVEDGGSASQKFELSPQLQDACKIMTTSLANGKDSVDDEQLEWAQKYLQHEWLKTSSSKRANPTHVADFLDELEELSPQLLSYVVNLCDQNENTALHYSVSRGHFDVVSLLLDTKMCNLNKPNKAGYTPVMLASLCPISSDTDSMVIQRLFQMGDVNIKASQHGQTALMLAVSHGNLETTKLLLEAGAGVNIQDEEGSTALMCAAEHGHKEIVRLLLAHPDIDARKTDNDRSTALSIAVDNGHKDIGVLIYAHLNYGRQPPSLRMTSFGWKRKYNSTNLRSSQIGDRFSPDEDGASTSEHKLDNVDWLTASKRQRSGIFEDAKTKGERLKSDGSILAENGRYWEAIKLWDEALSLLPRDAQIYEMKTQALLELREDFAAVCAGEQAVQCDRTWSTAYQTLGRAQLNLGEVHLALKSFCIAIHLAPWSIDIRNDDINWALSVLEKIKEHEKDQENNKRPLENAVCSRGFFI